MTKEELADCAREQRLAWFAREVIRASFDGLDVDPDTIQWFALAAGLIYTETVDADTDLRGVRDAECLERGDTFFREARDLIEAQPKAER